MVFILILIPLFLYRRKRWDMGIMMFIAAAAVGFIYFYSPLKVSQIIFGACIMPEVLYAVLSLILITLLGLLMNVKEQGKKIIDAVYTVVPDKRILYMAAPFISGLVPSSAEIEGGEEHIKETDPSNSVTPEHKAFFDYWYRNVWIFIIPLFPAFILLLTVLKITYRDLFLTMFPLSIIAFLCGLLGFIKMKKPSGGVSPGMTKKEAALFLLKETAPLLLVLLCIVAFNLNVAAGLGIAAAAVFISTRPSFKNLFPMIKKSITLNNTMLVFGMAALLGMLDATESLKPVSVFLSSRGLPDSGLMFFIPFAAGYLMGSIPVSTAFIFPVIMGMYPMGVPGRYVIINRLSDYFPWILNLSPQTGLGIFALAFVGIISGAMFSPQNKSLKRVLDKYGCTFENFQKILWIPVLILILAAVFFAMAGN